MKFDEWLEKTVYIRRHTATSDNNCADNVMLIIDKGVKISQYCKTCDRFVDTQ